MLEASSHQVPSTADLASLIDHTILRPDATEAQIGQFCAEALQYRFRSVCINPVRVRLVAQALAGSNVLACSVIGFPFGATTPAVKAAEAAGALADGAGEVDMVIDIGALKDGRLGAVRDDIAAVRRVSGGAVLKVIIETCLLTDEEKRTACRLAQEAGADFVKTSTGYSSGGATAEDVRLMRAAVGEALGVKASGGVRSLDAARAMVAAGASRIGTSSGVAIMTQAEAPAGAY
jgi:deoxyribose-phosphate aldolase